jgi:trehalose 6-phosphate phosphatase
MASAKSELNGEQTALAAELLAPFLDRPDRSALVFDVDGTLAPIVPRPEDAEVPAGTRALLEALEQRYGLVACISGRRAAEARRIVGLDSLTYIGNHGLESLPPGAKAPSVDPSIGELGERVRDFATSHSDQDLARFGIRLEDKDTIWSFHWRGAPDEEAARGALERVAREAAGEGLVPHWGRKVLEIRPPVEADKGTAIEAALAGASRAIEQALYAGDDTTDLDAFRKLRELDDAGALNTLCVGVRSKEGPAAISVDADLAVEGPEGLVGLLRTLAG